MKIRRLTDSYDDYEAFKSLYNVPYSYDKDNETSFLAKLDFEKELTYSDYCKELYKSQYVEFLALENDDKNVIAYAEIEKYDVFITIKRFVINQEYQRKSNGTIFFRKIEQQAIEEKKEFIDLNCMMRGAREFWKSLGFKSYIYMYFIKKL